MNERQELILGVIIILLTAIITSFVYGWLTGDWSWCEGCKILSNYSKEIW